MEAMNVRLIFAVILLAITTLISCGTAVHAQSLPTSGGVDISLSNDNPAPGQEVTITARSYSTNINAATVTWTVNGRVVTRGVGITTLSVKAPAMGKNTTIDVTVVSQDGITFENSIVLSSGTLDFVVEPGGYVPPFFAGKAPVTFQNNVKIIAIPHLANSTGVEYDPKNLIYRWEQGTAVLESQSGHGKQSIILPGTVIPRPYQLKVTVSSRDGSNSTSRVIAIAGSSPFITFYRNDPLYGPLYTTAINQNLYIGSTRETGVVAVPFGFNLPQSGLGTLTLKWLINGVLHPELSQNRTITLRAPAGSAGASNISLTIENPKSILQTADAQFSALFTAGTTTNSIAF